MNIPFRIHLLCMLLLSFAHFTFSEEINVGITVDNEILPFGKSETLDNILNQLLKISQESLTRGTYQFSLPKEFEEEYRQINKERSDEIKEHMQWAWSNYYKYCPGKDEILPLSGGCNNFWGGMGMMVVESIDTLWMMGLTKEYNEAREWIATKLSYDMDHYTSVFETIIRAVGGLLSAYALTGDEIFKEKVIDLADRLLESKVYAFPSNNVNLLYRTIRVDETTTHLSEIGSNLLEFDYLTEITGDPKYVQFSEAILQKIREVSPHKGLYPTHFTVHGSVVRKQYSIGNRADSFYEYLLKGWIRRAKKDQTLHKMYCDTLEGVESVLMKVSTKNETPFIADMQSRSMHHLACFFPGVLALGVKQQACSEAKQAEQVMQRAYQLTATCYQMYNSTQSGLSAESYSFSLLSEGEASDEGMKDFKVMGMPKYLLRPETVESLFVMYAKTKNPVFREWGWKIWNSIKKYCKGNYAFADLADVNNVAQGKDDRGETFFYSETMKYLYLLFSETGDEILDNYVFNTEAHPIPIKRGSYVCFMNKRITVGMSISTKTV